MPDAFLKADEQSLRIGLKSACQRLLFDKLFSFIMRLLYATLVSHSLLAYLSLMIDERLSIQARPGLRLTWRNPSHLPPIS